METDTPQSIKNRKRAHEGLNILSEINEIMKGNRQVKCGRWTGKKTFIVKITVKGFGPSPIFSEEGSD